MNNSVININVKDNIFNNNKTYLFINFSSIITNYTLELYSDDSSLIIESDIKINGQKTVSILSFEIDLGNNYFIKICYQKNNNIEKNIFHKFIYPNDYLKDNINFVIKKKKEDIDNQTFFNPYIHNTQETYNKVNIKPKINISNDTKSNNFNNLFFYCDEDSYDSNINNYLIDQCEYLSEEENESNEIEDEELFENDIIDNSKENNQNKLDISNNNYNCE